MSTKSRGSSRFLQRRPQRGEYAEAQKPLAQALATLAAGHPLPDIRSYRKIPDVFPAGRSIPLSLLIAFLKLLRILIVTILVLHLWFIITTSGLLLLYRYVDPPATVLMPYRSVLYRWKLQPPRPLPLKTIPTYLRTMLVAVEDGKFYTHHGLDFEAFARARKINAIVGRPLYGGSTLTMQLARTLFLVPEKSYIRKYFEIIVALEMEAILSKDRILELYFGYAEWGKGIFGIEAASRAYYKLPVDKLSRDQGARLIALLSSPILYNPATLGKSPILRERYAYLSRRYSGRNLRLPDSLPPLPIPPQGLEPEVLTAAQAAAAEPPTETVTSDTASPDAPGDSAPEAGPAPIAPDAALEQPGQNPGPVSPAETPPAVPVPAPAPEPTPAAVAQPANP